MAAPFSQNSTLKIKLCEKACKSCGLNIYQEPAFDQFKRSHIFWVGLSAVQFDEGQEKLPLSPFTPSGALIHSIERPLKRHFSFYKTNLVKCAPLHKDKLRYPLAHEMEKCFPNFEWELEHLNPRMVFLLGKQVSDFVMAKLGLPRPSFNGHFEYETFHKENMKFVPIHHPSYILVYKRKFVGNYTAHLQKLISASLKPSAKRGKRLSNISE